MYQPSVNRSVRVGIQFWWMVSLSLSLNQSQLEADLCQLIWAKALPGRGCWIDKRFQPSIPFLISPALGGKKTQKISHVNLCTGFPYALLDFFPKARAQKTEGEPWSTYLRSENVGFPLSLKRAVLSAAELAPSCIHEAAGVSLGIVTTVHLSKRNQNVELIIPVLTGAGVDGLPGPSNSAVLGMG